MSLLHICNDFCYSKVHTNLFSELDKLGIHQTVYTYFHYPKFYDANKFVSPNTTIIYSKQLIRYYHCLFYQYKISTFYKDLLDNINPLDYDCINATTLFSDGALAYRLNQKYHIPYIVAVRSTDLHLFLKYMLHTWNMGRNTLKNACKIIFVSKASMREFSQSFVLKDLLPAISSKFLVQPNGIDDFWLDNILNTRKANNEFLYVGQFVKRKNVLRLISAVLEVKKDIPNIRLNLVGGSGTQERRILELVRLYPEVLHYYGKIFDKCELLKVYRANSIFVMPSLHETFGLTYLEALSQDLIVIYTKGEDFDGLIDYKVGEAVNPKSVSDIAKALRKTIKKRGLYINNDAIDFRMYRWRVIAEKYLLLYQNIIYN